MLRKFRLIRLFLRGYSKNSTQSDLNDIQKDFDPTFYYSTNEDVALTGRSPVLHYLRYGWRERRDPSPNFSTSIYLARNPDVAYFGVNPFVHFVLHGRREGREAGDSEQDFLGSVGASDETVHEKNIYQFFQGRVKEPGLDQQIFDYPCTILAYTNRCGSNLLSDYLIQTGIFSGFEEMLNSDNVIHASRNYDIDYFSRYFCNVQLDNVRGTEKIYGFKASWSQTAMLQRWGIFELHDGVRIIHMKRRDLIGQAISMSIAGQTGSWTSEMKKNREPEFNFSQIRQHLNYAAFSNQAIEIICNVLSLPRLEVFYENLLEDSQGVIRDIGVFFDRDLSNRSIVEPLIKKQANAVNAKFREAFVAQFKEKFRF